MAEMSQFTTGRIWRQVQDVRSAPIASEMVSR